MKTMKSLLLVAAIAFSSVLSASTGNEKKAETAKTSEATMITDAVESLLKNPSFIIEEDLTAKVTLTINKDNEIVVLSVDCATSNRCDNNKLESYLKSRLNYNELPSAVVKGQKTFVVPVRITAEI